MDTLLVELFRHNLWANLRLLDVCAGLNDAQLAASAIGTYGKVRDTLVHIIASEELLLALLTGQRPEHALREAKPIPGFEELRQRAMQIGEELIRVVPETDPSQVIRGTRQGASYAIQATVPVIQTINHSTEHRAHVVTILSQLGLEPPQIDGWAYGRAKGVSDVGPTT